MIRDLGRCSLCRRPAERNNNGQWWHLSHACAGLVVHRAQPTKWAPARFIPDNNIMPAPPAAHSLRSIW